LPAQDDAVAEQLIDRVEVLIELAAPDILIGPDLGLDEIIEAGQGRGHYFLRFATAALAMRTALPSSPVTRFSTLLATSDALLLSCRALRLLRSCRAATLGFQGV
jgi:hypothetical protein